MKPIAYLTIIPRGPATSYRVTDTSGRLQWATRAYSTPEGRDGARERLRDWCRATGCRVVLVDPTPKVEQGKEVMRAG